MQEEEVKTQQNVSSEQEVFPNSYVINPGKNECIIVRSKQEVTKMLDSCKLVSGIKTSTQIEEEKNVNEPADKKDDINANKVSIPASFFVDFPEITELNKKDFEYLVYQIIIQFLDKFKDKALEFPSCIAAGGRSIIHDIGNCLDLAHHSAGGKNNRRIFIYPKTLFKEKQEQEKKRLAKETEKIKD